MSRGRSLLHALAALVLYGGLVTWLTWPLADRCADHLPDASQVRADPLYAIWALAWQTHALATDPWILPNANVYHPTRRALFYGPPGSGALPLFAPTFLASGNPALAINLTLLAGVTLSAWGLHLVVGRWTGSFAAALVAGSSLLATPMTVLWSAATPQYAALMYLPSLIALAAAPIRRLRHALALLVLVVLQALTDLVYVAPAVFLTLGIHAAWQCARPASRAAGGRLWAVLATALLLVLPAYAGYVAVRLDNPALLEQSVWSTADGPAARSESWGILDGPTAVPVWALGLALAGAVIRAQGAGGPGTIPAAVWWSAGLWAGVGVLLPLILPTLGTLLLRDGSTLFRIRGRLGVGSVFGLTMLAGLGFAEIARLLRLNRVRRLSPRATELALATAVILAVYADYRSTAPPEFPTQPAYMPTGADAALRDLAHRLPGPVLDFPVGGTGTSPLLHARAMYASIFHWRRLLNGYGSYWPAAFPERMALAARLPDPEALAELRRQTGLAVVVVRARDLLSFQYRPWQAVLADGTRTDLRLVHDGEGELIFAVTAAGG